MTPAPTAAECFARSYAPQTAALVARLGGDTEAVREVLAESDWSPSAIDAAMKAHEPAVRFGGAPLSGAELAIWQRARTLRVHGTRVRWTGERFYPDSHWLAEEDAVAPPCTRWTVVRTLLPKGRACKLWTWADAGWGEPDGFNLGLWVHTDEIDIQPGARGIADLFEAMSGDSRACVMRAIRARDDVKIPARDARGLTSTTGIRRGASAETGAFLAPHPIGRRGLILDIDKAALPEWFPRGRAPTPDEAARAVREVANMYLPRPWRGCELAYRWSASAGVKGWQVLSLHIAVWLDRPVYDKALHDWVSTWGKPIDPRTLVSVQPIYGPPIFEGGPDPLEAAGIPRCGFLEGDMAAVPVPAAFAPLKGGDLIPLVDGPGWHAHEQLQAGEVEARRLVARLRGALHALTTNDSKLDAWLDSYAAGALRHACNRIADAPHGVQGNGRHDTLLNEAVKIGAFVAGGHLDRKQAKCDLLDTYIAVAGSRRRKEGSNTIDDGFARAAPLTREELLSRRCA